MEQNTIKIWIVEDAEENRMVLDELCKGLGYETMLFENGKLAQQELKKGTLPSLILLDIKMPEMDGYEFLEYIKSKPKIKWLPVLMVTSVEDTSSVIRCLKIGAEDYISKPFQPEILKARIENALDRLNAYNMERHLLEKTFAGSIRVFSDILSLLSPQIFGKSARIRRIARILAEELSYPSWEMEVSAMLSMIGCISFPSELIDKIANGKVLVGEEKTLFDNHPMIGYKLLKHIPRLEKVAINVKYQNKTFDGRGVPLEEHIEGKNLPVGSQILRAAFEYDSITTKNQSLGQVFEEIKAKTGILSSEMINLLEKIIVNDFSNEIAEIPISELKAGVLLSEDIYTISNAKIAGKWQEVSPAFLERLKQIHKNMTIKEPIRIYASSYR